MKDSGTYGIERTDQHTKMKLEFIGQWDTILADRNLGHKGK